MTLWLAAKWELCGILLPDPAAQPGLVEEGARTPILKSENQVSKVNGLPKVTQARSNEWPHSSRLLSSW